MITRRLNRAEPTFLSTRDQLVRKEYCDSTAHCLGTICQLLIEIPLSYLYRYRGHLILPYDQSIDQSHWSI
jgi:hypothetical protein